MDCIARQRKEVSRKARFSIELRSVAKYPGRSPMQGKQRIAPHRIEMDGIARQRIRAEARSKVCNARHENDPQGWERHGREKKRTAKYRGLSPGQSKELDSHKMDALFHKLFPNEFHRRLDAA